MTTVAQISPRAEPYVRDFERMRDSLSRGALATFAARRQAAIDRFAETGFPGIRQEAWRQTNITAFIKAEFGVGAGQDRPTPEIDESALEPYLYETIFGPILVFIDGAFSPKHSRFDEMPGCGTIKAFSQINSNDGVHGTAPGALSEHLGAYLPDSHGAFANLNTAFFADGAFVHLPADVIFEKPIQILHIATATGVAASHPRTLIVLGANAKAGVIETFASATAASTNDGQHWTNAAAEISLGAGAQLDHIRIQAESDTAWHFGATQAVLGQGSIYRNHAVSIGARLSRNEIDALIDGENAECVLNGVYLTRGTQHHDTHTRLDHAKPNGRSHEVYRGILDGRSTAVFSGRIKVFEDAQKTDAIQSNAALLLTRDAQINTQPQLEIFADDVKCTHGATVGQIDETAMFYLRSRGIDPASARAMLIRAFANEAVEGIDVEPVRERLEAWMGRRFDEGRAALL